ncbi:hypothetical protein [Bacillus seohaeanensis]|uniref:TPM domain-containing protein n=1 Tax=Bacillus seohaeanensis TaxID=284580 RepID=A0ABW5RY98_9BACI
MTESNLPQLSPPQFTYFNEVKHSVGNDPFVTVLNIIELPHDAGYLIPVLVRNQEKAQALATIMESQKTFGNIVVYVVVIYDGQVVNPLTDTFTPQEMKKLVETALKTNRYFIFAAVERFSPGTESVYPVFSKSIIQFFNDDLSDLYNNFNEVAASVFSDVLRKEINSIPINPSTFDKSPK